MDTLLHPSHWFNTHDHHKCLFPFKVVAYKDYNGVHKNKEISFKRGDVIQVSGQCDENGHNIQDVPRISKRLRNGVINVKYPLYPTDDTNTFWVGRVMKYNPDTHHYAVTHDIGHFPVNCVALMENKAKLDQLKNESKSGTDAKKKNSHITVSMNTPHTMLEKQDDRLKVSFSDKNNLGITFRTCKHRDGSHKVFTVVESVDNSNTAGLENIEPFFLLANIGEENVEEKSHEEIEVILNTCEYPVTMTFVHPSEEKHPYNKHEHHQHMEHVTNIEANKFKDLEIELDFEEGKNENEEAVKYMYVKSSKHLALNNYVLSAFDIANLIQVNDGSLDEHNPVPYTATSTSQSDIGQRYDDVNKNATENSTAEKKHVQSNAKITAANRAEISSRSSSTSTISTISSIGNNDDKVAMEKKIQKEKKILRLAQKAQIDQKYAQAEMLFRKINRWQRACFMYFQDEKYQDAKRVAYKEAGKAGFEEVIFAWSKHLGKEKGADFVLEFGGIKVAIDFYCDRCEFERAFELSKERGGKAKIKDIHLKYGQFYEEQGNFPAAEKQYILAGKPREAIEMYKREDKVLHALRVAQEHEPAHVDDIEASLQLTVLDLINRSQTGLFSRRSINALQNDLSQRVNLRGDDRRMKHLKMSPRSRQRVARNGYMVEKKELANRERERMNINKNRRRQHELQQIRVASHDAYKKAFGGLNNKFSNVSWTKATIQDQHGLLRATQPIQIEYEKFKIQKFDPRKKTIQRRYAAGKLVPPPPPLRRRPNPDASSAYYSRGNNTNNNVLFSNNDNIITANNRSPRQTNKIKKSRFSPRPPDIYKMARAKNKRLRVSPITLFQQQKNKAPMQPVMSSLSLDDSLDDESILEIFNEDVTVVNVRKKVSVKLPPSPPTSSKTMLNSEQSPRKQRQRRQQRKKEQKTDKPAQNGQSPKEPSKQNKTADGETIIQGLELDLVLHDPTSFTIL